MKPVAWPGCRGGWYPLTESGPLSKIILESSNSLPLMTIFQDSGFIAMSVLESFSNRTDN